MEKHDKSFLYAVLGVALSVAAVTHSAHALDVAVGNSGQAQGVPGVSPGTLPAAWRAYRGKDYATAYRLFEQVESQNDTTVLFQLGFMDMIGEGTVRNREKARERYQKACDMEFKLACTALDSMDKHGL